MLGERVIGFAERGARLERALRDLLADGPESSAEVVNLEVLREQHPDASLHDSADYAASLEEGWDVLRGVAPVLHDSLREVVRHTVVFEARDAESFATPAAPGAVFLNAAPADGAAFFIEQLPHQGGHNLFHALSAQWDRLIAAGRDLRASTLTGMADDPRTLEVVLHGVFTQSLMCVALGASLEAGALAHDDRQQHELLGRLSFAMRRLQLDLTDVRRRDLYTEAGEELVIAFEEAFDDVYRAASGRITGFNLTNQPYAFSYDRFAELNA